MTQKEQHVNLFETFTIHIIELLRILLIKELLYRNSPRMAE
ncbi:MAG: hypothetical protein UZ01_00380 [Candidatus Brocadia sinica]|nr:MAG: hypothetical protein UZ01_00380 [Candidatus Brocadia sinica]